MTCVPPCKQVAVNGTLVIPEPKPDIERILRITSTPVITRTSVIEKKVVISGYILVCVEYVACVPSHSQPVHFASYKVPFADFVDHPCAHPGLTAVVKIEIEFQEFHAISPRCITKLIILKICIIKLKEKDCEQIPHPCPPPCLDPCPPGPCEDGWKKDSSANCPPLVNTGMPDDHDHNIACSQTASEFD